MQAQEDDSQGNEIRDITPKTDNPMNEFSQDLIHVMVKDPRSASDINNSKPTWYFLLSRSAQRVAMKKINTLYKRESGVGLSWEEKWANVEGVQRKTRPDDFAGLDEAAIHIRRFIVFDGDYDAGYPPDPFVGCTTESERLAVLLAPPTPSAKLALANYASLGQATTERVVQVTKAGQHGSIEGADQENGVPRKDAEFTMENTSAWERHGRADDEQDEEQTDDEDTLFHLLQESCAAGHKQDVSVLEELTVVEA